MKVPHTSFETDGPIAIMGGVYGNVPALEAGIDQARNRGCDRLVFLGDATGCCGHSDETLRLIYQHFDLVLAGNHEQQAAAGAESCGCNYADPEDERLGCLAHQLAMASLSETNRQWLGTWPELIHLDTPRGRLLLCHGSPDQTNEFLFESELEHARLNAWLDAAGAVGLLCTHTGVPCIRSLSGSRFAITCGGIGKPDHDGDPAVHFVILDPGEAPRKTGFERDNAPWLIELERVTYDHERWADQLEAEGVDPVFSQPLWTGVWTTGSKSLPAIERPVQQRPLHVEPAGPALGRSGCRSAKTE